MKKIFLYSLIVLLYNLTFSQNFNTQAHLVILNGEMCLLQEGKYFTLDKQVVTVKLKDYKRIPTNINVIRQNLLGYYDIKVPDNISYKTYMNYLNSLQIFSVIEYNGIGKYEVGNKTNDTEFGKQWYLSRIRTLEA